MIIPEDDVRVWESMGKLRLWKHTYIRVYGIWEYDDVRVMRAWGNEDYEGIWGYKWGGLTLGG